MTQCPSITPTLSWPEPQDHGSTEVGLEDDSTGTLHPPHWTRSNWQRVPTVGEDLCTRAADSGDEVTVRTSGCRICTAAFTAMAHSTLTKSGSQAVPRSQGLGAQAASYFRNKQAQNPEGLRTSVSKPSPPGARVSGSQTSTELC